jgi:hypothetical protein
VKGTPSFQNMIGLRGEKNPRKLRMFSIKNKVLCSLSEAIKMLSAVYAKEIRLLL